MRPCPLCSFGLDNNSAACPQCGAATASSVAPKATPGPPAEGPRPIRRAFADLADAARDEPLLFPIWFVVNLPFLMLLSVPLVAGGAVGYYVWDVVGAVAGVILAAVLVVAVKAWREERQPRRGADQQIRAPKKRRL